MHYISVRFFDPYKRDTLKGGEYTYKTNLPVEVGDLLVVDTRNGFALAQATSHPTIIPELSEDAWRAVVAVVDLAPWLEFEHWRFSSVHAT